jgi:hypothetical protein
MPNPTPLLPRLEQQIANNAFVGQCKPKVYLLDPRVWNDVLRLGLEMQARMQEILPRRAKWTSVHRSRLVIQDCLHI